MALSQTQWQALIDAARECKRKGTDLKNQKIPVYGSYPEGNNAEGVAGTTGAAKYYNLVDLVISAVVDATTQLQATTNTAAVVAIPANTFTDG
jgi:tagatose-1,6-bisphosphate aldolase